jgi:GntR family transcriptional regulator/MocR family aminotransferase
MAKRARSALLESLRIDRAAPTPLYHQVYLEIRRIILSGALAPGSWIPSSRTLADDLGISRTPTKAAYERLAAEGYIESQVGAGSRVARLKLPIGARPPRADSAPDIYKLLSRRGRVLRQLSLDLSRDVSRPFTPHLPDYTAFPVKLWSRLGARHSADLSDLTLNYAPPAGQPALREAIAGHLNVFRNLKCAPEQVIVISSTQQAIAILATILADADDVALMEEPGYRAVYNAFALSGLNVQPLPVDQDGFVPPAAGQLPERTRLAYATPAKQWPLGMTMGPSRRLQVIQWLHATGIWLIEDDSDSELRYRSVPAPPLQSMDRFGRVIYMGSFSRILFPALRLGYLVLPKPLVEPFTAALEVLGRSAAGLTQLILADFIAEGHFSQHIRRMRRIYEDKQQMLLQALTQQMAGIAEPEPTDTGMHMVVSLAEGYGAARIAAAAQRRGLTARPIAYYSLSGRYRRQALMLGFGCVARGQFAGAVRSLVAAAQEAGRHS